MVGAIVQNSLHAYHRISGQRALLDGFLKSLFHCGIIVLRHSAAYYLLGKFILLLQISQRLKFHLNMAVLSMSAGLLFIFIFHVRFLADSLTERNLGLAQFDFHLIFIQEPAHHNIQMLIAHAVKQ